MSSIRSRRFSQQQKRRPEFGRRFSIIFFGRSTQIFCVPAQAPPIDLACQIPRNFRKFASPTRYAPWRTIPGPAADLSCFNNYTPDPQKSIPVFTLQKSVLRGYAALLLPLLLRICQANYFMGITLSHKFGHAERILGPC